MKAKYNTDVFILDKFYPMSSNLRQTPLTCSGHARPVVFLAFSEIDSHGICYSTSACKDGKPMLRQGNTGDWIGTFEGHKGGRVVGQCQQGRHQGRYWCSGRLSQGVGRPERRGGLTLQHKHIVQSVNVSNDRAALATVSNDKVLRIFDLGQPSETIVKFDGPISGLKQAMYPPDNKQLLSDNDQQDCQD